ncbi:hypothetical protein [Marinilactibacillus kalidii]|uniref:hypothetical protein n=1 Tax=Marinilactibacillus kalidii TaxID=2820274 RepID=UPI001ABDB46A|nr:hypothetical protein [Marinilactibacillus kalidii]
MNYLKNSDNEQTYFAKIEYYLSLIEDEKTERQQTNKSLEDTNLKVIKLKEEIGKIENENKQGNTNDTGILGGDSNDGEKKMS